MTDSLHSLVCRAGDVLVALPLGHVAEVMRPLPVQRVRSDVPFVAGVSVIRGESVPVVHLATLLSDDVHAVTTRFMRVRAATQRHIALAVSEVLGVRSLAPAQVAVFPPLLRSGALAYVTALGALDREVLLVLQAGRVLPETAWVELQAEPS